MRISWRITRRIGIGLGLLLASLLAIARLEGFGCNTHRGGGAAAPVSNADLLEGSWSGSWASSQRDMGGNLDCRIQKLGDGVYQARFEAVFAKVFTNTSTVKLTVQRRDSAWEFSGQEDLGLLKGGIYKYDGHSDGAEFVCNYDSKYDKGTFRMKRAGATTRPGR